MFSGLKRDRDLATDLAVLAGGAGIVLAATLAGRDARLVALLVAPPPLARVALVGAALLLAFVALGRAVERLRDAARPRDTIRGARFVFLAVAAASAAAGWLLGSALPIVVAGVIAGVDVVETTFLLVALGLESRRR